MSLRVSRSAGYGFKNGCFLTPHEYPPLGDHPAEKVNILSPAKPEPGIEEVRCAAKQISFQENVRRPRVGPSENGAGLVLVCVVASRKIVRGQPILEVDFRSAASRARERRRRDTS